MEDTKTETSSLRRALPPWSQEVLHKVAELRDQLPQVDDAHHRASVATLITEAEAFATLRKPGKEVWAQIREWWYGSRVEQAWTCLHQAELGLVEHGKSEFLETTALEIALSLGSVLDAKDPLRLRLENYVRSLPDPLKPPAPAPGPGAAPVPVPPAHAQAHAAAHAGAVAAAPGSTTTTSTSTTTPAG
ncbi:MAG TPA: hypothetical protein VGG09_13215 [Acidimicrobiales bacterium]|jgi:hypothetical protein